jgi:3-oxoacyl-(acyl-carrier-protein) synthase
VAGIYEAAITETGVGGFNGLMALSTDGDIPKGINFNLKKSEKKVMNVAMNNTFGFGGHNVINLSCYL